MMDEMRGQECVENLLQKVFIGPISELLDEFEEILGTLGCGEDCGSMHRFPLRSS